MPDTDPLVFDPFSLEARLDPYPAYTAMREHFPVYHQEDLDLRFVSRYEDVNQVLNDWGTFTTEQGEDIDDTAGLIERPGNLTENDPPQHDVLRRVLQPAFAPKELASRISETIDTEVADIVARLKGLAGSSFDFSKEIAEPLPVVVVSELLGVPVEDRPALLRAMVALVRRDPGVAKPPESAIEAVAFQHEYFASLLEKKRRAPDGRIVALIAAAEDAGTLNTDQAVGLSLILFAAAIDTTGSLLNNSAYLLSIHGEQQAALRRDPSLIPSAVEETLRFESPIQNAKRVATVDTNIAGTDIPAGSTVVPLFGSANRDTTQFPDADTFDISRPKKRNLAFGSGVHHCIGAALARRETTTTLTALVAELPPFELAGETERFPSHVIRGFASLPLRFA